MKPISKITIRRSRGPKPGWKLNIDGHSDKNHYWSWEKALASVIFRLRRRAVEQLFEEAAATPGEYTGIPAAHIHGADLRLKRQNLAAAAYERDMRVDIHGEDDGDGNYWFYVGMLGRRQ